MTDPETEIQRDEGDHWSRVETFLHACWMLVLDVGTWLLRLFERRRVTHRESIGSDWIDYLKDTDNWDGYIAECDCYFCRGVREDYESWRQKRITRRPTKWRTKREILSKTKSTIKNTK